MPTSSNPGSFILGLIGGSGLYALPGFGPAEPFSVLTPFDAVPVTITAYNKGAVRVLFLPRHGTDHQVAPHNINYRANLWALQKAGAQALVAVNTVGGISEPMQAGVLCLPDQIIDYTWGRTSTFSELDSLQVIHTDFTFPFDQYMREILLQGASAGGISLVSAGVYGCTQGPRLETAAEIRRLARDGCDLVGMTGMPEAILARELALPYAMLSLVVNSAAGLDGKALDLAAMHAVADTGIARIQALLLQAISILSMSRQT